MCRRGTKISDGPGARRESDRSLMAGDRVKGAINWRTLEATTPNASTHFAATIAPRTGRDAALKAWRLGCAASFAAQESVARP
jgi:hypothetical protein